MVVMFAPEHLLSLCDVYARLLALAQTYGPASTLR
jgi:hypothetical protein